MSIEKAKAYLRQFGAEDRVIEFPVSSATVELAAEAAHCEPARIAKTLSFRTNDGVILIVAAGDTKIDNPKYKARFGCKARMLAFEEVEPEIGHAVGGVCPFGVNDGVTVYLDESLRRFETVFPACGSSNSAIEVTIPEPESKPTPVTDMAILYDDEDIVVVDKPVGVAAHTGPGWEGPTVLGNLEAAGYRITSYGPPERQGIVHRLDVGTSGAMMVAKSELAYTVMKRAFKERTIEKVYHAVVAGHLDPASGTIDAPIGRHPSREWRMAVIDGGKRARIVHEGQRQPLPDERARPLAVEGGPRPHL